MSKDKNECLNNKVNTRKKLKKESINIELTKEEFDRFMELCKTEHVLPIRLKKAAQRLDEEGF